MTSPFLPGTGRRVRAGLRWLAKHALVLFPLLLALEGVLQATAPSYRNQVFDHEFTGGHPLEVNEEGYRGAAISVRKEEGEYRILALGDSTTLGTGVATSATWPFRLRDHIAAAGVPASVLNTGVPACRMSELVLAFEEKWSRYAPDLVVLAVSNNLPSFGWIRREDRVSSPYARFTEAESKLGRLALLRIEVNRVLHKLCLPSFLSRNSQRAMYWLGLANHSVNPNAPYGPMLAHGWIQGNLDPAIAGDAWRLFEQDLTRLAGVVEQSGARFVVTHLPSRFMLTEQPRDNEKRVPRDRLTLDPTAEVAAICQRLGISYVDARAGLLQARGPDDDELYIPFDSTHLNPVGHNAVASAVFERVDVVRRHQN